MKFITPKRCTIKSINAALDSAGVNAKVFFDPNHRDYLSLDYMHHDQNGYPYYLTQRTVYDNLRIFAESLEKGHIKLTNYPPVLDFLKVRKYPALVSAGGGWVWDEVLEYRVWCNPAHAGHPGPNFDHYYCAFARYEDALEYSKRTLGAGEPVALVLQRESINEPEPGYFEHVRTKRLTEWPIEFLNGPKRTPQTIPAFLAVARALTQRKS
jgi:hypothetical protein